MPTLLLNPRNDPFVPAASLPRPGEVSRWVTLWQPETGGHVGFPQGRFPGHVRAMPQLVAHGCLRRQGECMPDRTRP